MCIRDRTKIVEEVLPPKRVFPYPFKNNNPLTAGVRELLFVTCLLYTSSVSGGCFPKSIFSTFKGSTLPCLLYTSILHIASDKS